MFDAFDYYSIFSRFLVHYCGETPISVRYEYYIIYYAEQIWSDEKSQTCKGPLSPYLPYGACGCESSDLRYIYPPMIYDMTIDQQERFPLNSTDYMDIIIEASDLLEQHLNGVIPV